MELKMKYFIIFIIIYSSQAFGVITKDSWNFTHNVYLATPVYIYTEKSMITPRGGSLFGNTDKVWTKPSKQQSYSHTVHYIFKIDEVLYGKEEVTYHLEFSFQGEYKTCDLNISFNKHTDKTFWDTQVGRSVYSQDSFHACFELNKQYLLIGNNQFDRKMYELIESSDDEWLKHVKEKIKTIIPFEEVLERIKEEEK
jgi:hypothetical protein